jgi:hypothetical protein
MSPDNEALKRIDGISVGSGIGEAVVFVGGVPLHLYLYADTIDEQLEKLPKTAERASEYAASFGFLLSEEEAKKEAEKCKNIAREIRKIYEGKTEEK